MMESNPKKDELWVGAVLYGIIHAVITSQNHVFAAMRYWFRNHYVLNGIDGREGVVTFAGGHWYPKGPLIGVFHDVHSDSFAPDTELDKELFFRGCPGYHRSLADQHALRHLEYPYEGRRLHRVTSAFWDNGEYLLGADVWSNMLCNGVSLIVDELSNRNQDEVFSELTEDFSLPVSNLARFLFEKKMARPPSVIELDKRELQELRATSTAEDPDSALQECREMLSELGVVVV